MPKKGKKETKAEREAAEQRRLAEEERLRVEEQERKIREEEELKLNEKISAFLSREKTRLNSMLDEYKGLLKSDSDVLNQILGTKLLESEWNQYLECSDLPNPKSERDLNTFLILWGDEKLVFDHIPTLNTLYKQLPTCSKLMEKLELEKAELSETGRFEKAKIIQDHMTRLSVILLQKCDIVTSQILHKLHLFPRESTENVQIEKSEDNFKFGLWTNLTKNPKHKVIEFLHSTMTCSIPISLTFQNIAIRMMYSMNFNNLFPSASDSVMVATGGILMLDLLDLPEPPKFANNWTITPMATDDYIMRLPYPKKKQGDDKTNQDDLAHSFQVSITLPNYTENLKVKFWNNALKDWDEEGIREQQYDVVNKKLWFWTNHFAPHGLVRNLYMEFPYRNWCLQLAVDGVNLSIEGKFSQIEILISEKGCKALGVNGITEFYSPTMLLTKLSQAGFGFIGPSNGEAPELTRKDINTEEQSIEGIARHAFALKFQMSPSNIALSNTTTAFQFCSAQNSSEWQSVVFNSSYRYKEELMPIAFIADTNLITDKTKLNMNGSESKLITPTVHQTLSATTDQQQTPSPLLLSSIIQVLKMTKILSS